MFSRAPILVQHPLAGGGERDHAQLLDQGEGAAGDEEDEPSPLDQEDLLVHNVQREKARCVRYVDLPNRAVGEEVTLGHLGQDLMQGVHLINLLLFEVVVVPETKAIVNPPLLHHLVHQDHLQHDVDQVEHLHRHELVGKADVCGLEPAIASGQPLHPDHPPIIVQLWQTHSASTELQSSALTALPDDPRGVERQCLTEIAC